MNCIRLGRMIRKSLVAIASVYSADALAQSPGCATRFTFCAGCDTFTTISMQTGKVCTIRYRTTSAIFSQQVVVRPRGGVYGTANETYGAYNPNPDFVRSDSFQLAIDY